MYFSSPEPETISTAAPPRRRLSRRIAAFVAAPLLLLAGLSVTGKAAANEDGGPGMHGHGGGMRLFHHMLDVAGATDAQRAQIKAIWEPLRPQLRAVGEQHFKLRQAIHQALTAPTIDTAAIEKLRQDGVQLMDKRSALFTQGMVASAQVLTPEQRQKIQGEIQKDAANHPHPFGEPAP